MIKLEAFITQRPVVKDFPAHPLIRGAGRYPNGEVESLERHQYVHDPNEGKKEANQSMKF